MNPKCYFSGFSLTCHKPHPNPHSHSNRQPCDCARHGDQCTHNSTEDRPDLVFDGISSSWRQLRKHRWGQVSFLRKKIKTNKKKPYHSCEGTKFKF